MPWNIIGRFSILSNTSKIHVKVDAVLQGINKLYNTDLTVDKKKELNTINTFIEKHYKNYNKDLERYKDFRMRSKFMKKNMELFNELLVKIDRGLKRDFTEYEGLKEACRIKNN